jgi:hypothetical protein
MLQCREYLHKYKNSYRRYGVDKNIQIILFSRIMICGEKYFQRLPPVAYSVGLRCHIGPRL